MIEKIREYLYSAHQLISADKDRTLWNEIETFRLVRNLIVHDAARLSSKHPQRQQLMELFVTYNVVVDHTTSEFYIREQKFLSDFIDKIKAYSWDIVKEVAPVPPQPTIQP